jgi:Flp pilus assembly protein protease CpaA
MVLPMILHRVSGMGGGDVKLLGAVGALCGPVLGMQVELYSFVAVVLYAPAKLAYAGTLLQTARRCAALAASPFLPKDRRPQLSEEFKTTIRFAPAALCGVAATGLAHWRLG